MGSKIVFLSGPDKGKEVWIEEALIRIGSDPSCAVCLTDRGLPAHVASVEYRAGTYYLYNRMEANIRIQGAVVARGQFARWAAGAEVHLTPQLAVRLDVVGDPAPSKRPAQGRAGLPEPLGANEPAAAPAKKSNNKQQWLIILGSIGLIAAFLFIDVDPEEPVSHDVPEEFMELVQPLAQSPDRDSQELAQDLQSARIAQLRSQYNKAQILYEKICDRLRRGSIENPKLSAEELKVWNFVTEQLAIVKAKSSP